MCCYLLCGTYFGYMRYMAVVSYDGFAYSGWQIQPQATSIQEVIEDALRVMHKESIKVVGSGRTDALVHAFAQVFHFDSFLELDSNTWVRALNSYLPDDIRIQSVEKVADDFHARYDAKFKTYQYHLNIGNFNVFDRNYVYQYNRMLDFEKVDAIIPHLMGEKDYTAFNATSKEVIENQIRCVSEFRYTVENERVIFTITGNGFLRHMVRMLVATVLAYNEDRIDSETVQRAFIEGDKRLIPYNVPGCGLYLYKVIY